MSMGTFGTTNVYCDMATANGGVDRDTEKGWRQLISFFQELGEYEDAFGNINGSYELKLMHFLTQSGKWEMKGDFKQVQKLCI